VRTGGNARVQVKMAEGSTVKLGENAKVTIERVENRGIFRAALNVLAARSASPPTRLRKSSPRDVTIKVKNVTAGIRGTTCGEVHRRARPRVPPRRQDQRRRRGTSHRHPRHAARLLPEAARRARRKWRRWTRPRSTSGRRKRTSRRTARPARAGGAGAWWRRPSPKRDEALALSRKLRGAGYPASVASGANGFDVQVAGSRARARRAP
jgi:hypothetical protein